MRATKAGDWLRPARRVGKEAALISAAVVVGMATVLYPSSLGRSDHTAAAATLEALAFNFPAPAAGPAPAAVRTIRFAEPAGPVVRGIEPAPPASFAPAQARNVRPAEPAKPEPAAVRTIRPAGPAAVRTIRPGERAVRVVRVAKGDTLMKILVDQGVPREEAHDAITALKRVFDPRTLKAGQEIALRFTPRLGGEAGKGALQAIRLAPDLEHEFGVDRRGPVFAAVQGRPQITVETVRTGGTITTSLYDAAQRAGVPPEVLVELISAFSFDVDFQRDLQPGDSFEVVFERRVNGDRSAAKPGDILYATLTLSGDAISIYRYAPDGEDFDYFNQKGESVRKALLRTPIDGARLSSRFGKRKHPILGYTRMHRGVDFAAPNGTPIMAAGDGLVAKAGRNGNYGNYVEIRHNGEFSTAYAHLSRFAQGVRQGRRVRQGEVIGFVGTSGLSTGPHLHFEVIRNDKKINPLAVKLPSGRKLAGADLTKFFAARAEIDRKLAGLPLDTEVASKR